MSALCVLRGAAFEQKNILLHTLPLKQNSRRGYIYLVNPVFSHCLPSMHIIHSKGRAMFCRRVMQGGNFIMYRRVRSNSRRGCGCGCNCNDSGVGNSQTRSESTVTCGANLVAAGTAGCEANDCALGNQCNLAQISFPSQNYYSGFCPNESLAQGTMFPELVRLYK